MTFINKAKLWFITAWALVTAALAALFFYERNKSQVNEALVDQTKLNGELMEQNDKIAANDATLKDEEAKRAALEKEVNSNANIVDIVEYLNKSK